MFFVFFLMRIVAVVVFASDAFVMFHCLVAIVVVYLLLTKYVQTDSAKGSLHWHPLHPAFLPFSSLVLILLFSSSAAQQWRLTHFDMIALPTLCA